METINVQIKLTPGKPPRPATFKVMLPKPTKEQQAQGLLHRPLEPYEIVALPRPLAEQWLEALPYELEMTHKAATRPLYFNDIRERDMSSMDYKEAIGGRADEVAEKVAAERERQAAELAEQEANKPAPAPGQNISSETVAAVVAMLESQGFVFEKKELPEPAPVNNAAVDGDEDLVVEEDDYIPQNNTTTQADLEAIVEEEKAAAGDDADKVEAPVMVRDTLVEDEDEPTPPPPQRRRRRARSTE